ncbi:DEHA2F21538p [Debaryomyces hansenii CBS767]|jgi:hypothetical protein|uniref:DEHA2F21538p n=1 Tax=Debaryomyces hansenii (strain ATCC 36239 / CBS 767 / BCRC 21394 / JCM 1990 / NBRC 0083 / IGC 2968) TaxID=284592 RepID=Q6BKJ1_DEBHA|nr:DEHA2F21538p [Debaryomyces hansenii CBS767]CAG89679.1 DEHA2F21538p [Debaryomyces hansenii CBS767]|eukprot:XP_461280.1 DEHA2F21538p [Debaryomyces hansenii CBS767]
MRFIFFILALITAIAAKSSSTTTAETTVWRTGTNSEGVTVTTQAIFTPSFRSTYGDSDTTSMLAGTIGMGSLSGTVGKVRSYSHTTISSGAFSFKTTLSASDRGMGIQSSILIGLLSAFGLYVMFVF